jgi:hypothetical protein
MILMSRFQSWPSANADSSFPARANGKQNKFQSANFANGRGYDAKVGNFSETFCWRPGVSIIGGFRFPDMKTRIMKRLLRILLVALFAVALAQLYRANMELKYNYEALAWLMESESYQFEANIAKSYQRTCQDAQKIAELEAQIQALTADKSRAN